MKSSMFRRGDPVLEVGLHPVLHAGVRVHDVPVTGLGAQRRTELLERVDRARRSTTVCIVSGSPSTSVSSPAGASTAGSWARERPRRGLLSRGRLDRGLLDRDLVTHRSTAARRPASPSVVQVDLGRGVDRRLVDATRCERTLDHVVRGRGVLLVRHSWLCHGWVLPLVVGCGVASGC